MTIKTRRIHLFLQFFFVSVGLFQIIKFSGMVQAGDLSQNIFQFSNNNLPILQLTSIILSGLTSFICCFALWSRVKWVYGFCLFTSGLLFGFHLLNLGSAIYYNSYEIIPNVIILIVLLQSFPFLLRRSYRSA